MRQSTSVKVNHRSVLQTLKTNHFKIVLRCRNIDKHFDVKCSAFCTSSFLFSLYPLARISNRGGETFLGVFSGLHTWSSKKKRISAQGQILPFLITNKSKRGQKDKRSQRHKNRPRKIIQRRYYSSSFSSYKRSLRHTVWTCLIPLSAVNVTTTPSYACLFPKVSATNKLLFYLPICGLASFIFPHC